MMADNFQAIVVGIEEYDNRTLWEPLPGVANVASRVARIFGAKPFPFPQEGETIPEVSKEAQSLFKAITQETLELPERSTLFFHWIGHGVTNGGKHYLICKDSTAPNVLNAATAIPSDELGRTIASSKAEKVVVVLDTCYSGKGGGDLAQRYRDNLAEQLPKEGWKRVICVLAASHPLSEAVAGRFSEALATVLENPSAHLKWTKAEQYIDPERLAWAAEELLAANHNPIHPDYEKSGLGWDIIPNPQYRSEKGSSDFETRQRLEGVFGDKGHFNLAARGIETGEAGYFFSGRRRTQDEIIRWLNEKDSRVKVVTGPPGSGKSAVIGRIVTLSVPEIREELAKAGALAEGDPIPPDNAVDISVHARGKTAEKVAAAIGRAAGHDREVLDASGMADVLNTVRQSGQPRTIVIDALDEAVDGDAERIAQELIHPLADMEHVRLLVGTRRSLDGGVIPDREDRHGRLRTAFGQETDILDLADEPDTQADIAAFVKKRLESAADRGSDAWIEDASQKVAAAAGGSFLYARLMARSLEATPNQTLDAMPADATQAFVQDIARRFPEDIARVTDMLRALAFGLGLGLSRAVWAPVATCFGKPPVPYTDGDIVWMLRNAGSYLIETTVTTDGSGQAVYRLIHQALADHLRQRVTAPHAKIVATLSEGIQGEAWLTVDPYLRRHLAEHALLAWQEQQEGAAPDVERMLEPMFLDPGALAVLEPAGVLAAAPRLRSDRVRRMREVYSLAAADLMGMDKPLERWALLHLTALMQTEGELAAALTPPAASPWQARWARTRPVVPHLQMLGRHSGDVSGVGLGSVAGRMMIVSGGDDGAVRCWDAETAAPIGQPLTGHQGPVLSVTLGMVADQAVIVSGGHDGTVRCRNAETGEPIGKQLTVHQGGVRSVTLGMVAGRAMIVSGGHDGTVRCWDAVTGEEPLGKPLTGHQGPVLSVTLGMVVDQTVIVSWGGDRTVRHWNAKSGEPLGEPLRGRQGLARSVALGMVAGQTMIVSGGSDGTVRLWNTETAAPIGEQPTRHEGWVRSVTLGMVAGRTMIVSGGDDRTVRCWNAETGEPIGKPLTGHQGGVRSVTFGIVASRAVIVSGGDDCTVRCWNAETGEPIGRPLTEHQGGVCYVTLGMVAGRAAIVSCEDDGTVRCWNAETSEPIGKPLRAVIGLGEDDGSMLCWGVKTRDPFEVPLFIGHQGGVRSITLGMLAGRAVIVSGEGDGTVRRWDAETGAPIGELLTGHQGWVRSVTLGMVAGRAVIVSGGDDGTVRLWNAATGDQTAALPLGQSILQVALSASGLLVAATPRGLIAIQIRP